MDLYWFHHKAIVVAAGAGRARGLRKRLVLVLEVVHTSKTGTVAG